MNKKLIHGKYGTGWKKDIPDARDFKFKKVGMLRAALLPSSVDLRPNCPAVYDQLSLGSCTGNGIAAVHQIAQMKQKLTDAFMPSRLFIYYGEREMEGTIEQDSGAQIRDGIKFVAATGVCPENIWCYEPSRFTIKPNEECYSIAKGHTVSSYERLDNTNINQLKLCLSDGYPIVFGTTLYESFENENVASTGMVPMPKDDERIIGGHCMTIVGYLDSIQCFIVRNSWGDSWGKDGYCFIPYAYLTDGDIADDFWTIKLVNDAPIPKTTWWWEKIFNWF